MEIIDIGKMVGEYGIFIVLACLFIWYTIQDRIKNQALLEEIKELVKTIKMSIENTSNTLELLQNGCERIDDKIDRNYEAIKYGGGDK